MWSRDCPHQQPCGGQHFAEFVAAVIMVSGDAIPASRPTQARRKVFAIGGAN